MGFYEEIAEDYDAMARFHERVPAETAMLKTWVERYQWRSAVDAACGTGLHAILLAQLGLQPIVAASRVTAPHRMAKSSFATPEYLSPRALIFFHAQPVD